MGHDKHVIQGVGMVIGLLLVLSLGSWAMTGYSTSSLGDGQDFRMPLMILVVAASGLIVLYVYSKRHATF
jgi:hypothetical protein